MSKKAKIIDDEKRDLHGLCTGGTEFTRDNNLASLGTTLHDKSENTIACPTDGQTGPQLVLETLSLNDGRQCTVRDFLTEQIEPERAISIWKIGRMMWGDSRVGSVLESLGEQHRHFPDPTAVLAKDFLGVRGTDDDLRFQAFSKDVWNVQGKERMTSVRAWALRISQPAKPSSASSRVRYSVNSARKTPSATNLRFLEIKRWAGMAGEGMWEWEGRDEFGEVG